MRVRARLAKVGFACLITTRGQCINGGWSNFSAVRNEGQCITYVVTAGKHA